MAVFAPLAPLARRLRRFRRSERGSILTEACIVLPLWVWGYAMSYQFFDAFREQTQNIRAAYTVADMLSRELNAVGPTYIDQLHDAFDYMTGGGHATWMRVTSVYYDDTNKVYKQNWSYSTAAAAHPVLTDTSVNALSARLPNLSIGETVVLVETGMQYTPFLNFGIDDLWGGLFIETDPNPRFQGLTQSWFENFIPTRPRFAAQVTYSSSS
jgi:Flp pilus assembly protein TadG